jgi:hypothetical protein
MLKGMRHRTMTQIVAQPGDSHTKPLHRCDPEARLDVCKMIDQLASESADANGVLEPAVRCTRKHERSPAELLEIPKTLELWSVDDANACTMNRNKTMENIVEELRGYWHAGNGHRLCVVRDTAKRGRAHFQTAA